MPEWLQHVLDALSDVTAPAAARFFVLKVSPARPPRARAF
jgi:hypothetical protein